MASEPERRPSGASATARPPEPRAERRGALRARAEELRLARVELEFRSEEVAALRAKISQSDKSYNAKLCDHRAQRPLREPFEAWRAHAREARRTSAMAKAGGWSDVLDQAKRCLGYARRRVEGKAARGGRLLEKIWVYWLMVQQTVRSQTALAQNLEGQEQEHRALARELAEERAQTRPAEERARREAARLRQELSAAQREVRGGGGGLDGGELDDEAPASICLLSHEVLAVRRAEAAARRRLLEAELLELRQSTDTFWDRARPYLHPSRLRDPSAEVTIDAEAVALALGRVVTPLAGYANAAEAIPALVHATGASHVPGPWPRLPEPSSAGPALLPSHYRLDAHAPRPASLNPPLAAKAHSAQADLSRLLAACALLGAGQELGAPLRRLPSPARAGAEEWPGSGRGEGPRLPAAWPLPVPKACSHSVSVVAAAR